MNKIEHKTNELPNSVYEKFDINGLTDFLN